MAVLVIADVPGQTAEGYDGMLAALETELKEAPGFIAHGAGPSVDGWKTFEVWETLSEATRFFAGYVRPLLPEGVRPKRTIVELRRARPRPAGNAAPGTRRGHLRAGPGAPGLDRRSRRAAGA